MARAVHIFRSGGPRKAQRSKDTETAHAYSMSVLQPVIWTFGLAAVLRNFLGFQNFMTMVADATLTHNVLDVDCRSNLHPKAKLRKISIRGNEIGDFFALDRYFFRGGAERHVSVSTVHGALPIRFRLQISEKSPRLSTFWVTFDFRIGKKVRMRYVRTSDYGDNLLCIYKNCMIWVDLIDSARSASLFHWFHQKAYKSVQIYQHLL